MVLSLVTTTDSVRLCECVYPLHSTFGLFNSVVLSSVSHITASQSISDTPLPLELPGSADIWTLKWNLNLSALFVLKCFSRVNSSWWCTTCHCGSIWKCRPRNKGKKSNCHHSCIRKIMPPVWNVYKCREIGRTLSAVSAETPHP